jgi:DNA-binding transcriptional MerR regulator
MSPGPFTLRQFADALGVDASIVRVLLEAGLLQPPRRRRGRQDDVGFHQEHVERLRFIKRALAVGLHLDDIALLVDPNGLTTCGDVYRLSSQRLIEMQRSNEDTRPLEALVWECRSHSPNAVVRTCLAKVGRKDCLILAKLHGFAGED